jgi:hypothetical protein
VGLQHEPEAAMTAHARLLRGALRRRVAAVAAERDVSGAALVDLDGADRTQPSHA